MFKHLHGWDTYNLVTGFNNRSVSSEGTTENLLSYNGSVAISQNSATSSNDLKEIENSYFLNENLNKITTLENKFDLNTLLFPFDYKYPDVDGEGSWLVSLLKKDGTWDLVYRQYTGLLDSPLDLKMSNLEIDSNHDQYQRTCDGYIRCRITHYRQEYDNFYHKIKYNIENHYYVIDYLPQRVKMGYNENSATATTSKMSVDNDYSQDIRIDINGLEGVNRIVVEQLDEGNEVPIKFEVPDFKKGYFTATVDKELYTQFVVYSYNKNGSTKSDYLTIAPLSPIQQLYNVQIEGNTINLSSFQSNNQSDNSMYKIYSINSISPLIEGIVEMPNSVINISELRNGNYILKITSGTNHQTIKFTK